MVYKIMSILDILAALSLIFSFFVPNWMMLIFGLYLLLKGFIFFVGGDFISFLDLLCGVYFGAFVFGFSYTIINILVVIFLVQKGVVGLVF